MSQTWYVRIHFGGSNKFDTALKDQWKPIKLLCRSNCKAGTAYDMVEVPKGRVNAYLPNHYHSLRVLIFANNNILQVELLKKSPWLDSVAWGQRSKSDLKKDGKMGGTKFGAQPFSLLILVTCISTLVSDVFLSKNLQSASTSDSVNISARTISYSENVASA